MKSKNIFQGVIAIAITGALIGCNTDDNPTSADKMQAIRHKEAADRANFHPTGGPPPSSPGSSANRNGMPAGGKNGP